MSKLIEAHTHPLSGVKTLTYEDRQEIYSKEGNLIAKVAPDGTDLLAPKEEGDSSVLDKLTELVEVGEQIAANPPILAESKPLITDGTDTIHVGDRVKVMNGNHAGTYATVVSGNNDNDLLVVALDFEPGTTPEKIEVHPNDLQLYDVVPPESPTEPQA